MTKELTLPSGKIAIIEEGRGKDLLQAQMKAKTPDEIPYALIAELAEIDGNRLVYEDILEMDLSDVIALQSVISGKLTVSPKETPKAKIQETKANTATETISPISPTAKA